MSLLSARSCFSAQQGKNSCSSDSTLQFATRELPNDTNAGIRVTLSSPSSSILCLAWKGKVKSTCNENVDQYLSLNHWLRLFKCNRFWRYTSAISAEVNTSWTELKGKGSPPTYTLDKFWARKGIFCTVFACQICTGLHKIYSYALLTKREVKMAGY